jgi:ABC-type branched-subunit amino acid transport system substrate-binding protein
MVVGLAILASACTGGPRVIPAPEKPAVEAPKPAATPRPVQPGIPEDLNRHRVALLVPLTGSNSGVGKSLADATQLAQLDSGSQAIRITTYDTAMGAAAAAQRAIADGNQLILGPLLAEDVRAVAPIARHANIPVLSFSNDVSVAGNGVFLMGYSPSQSVARVVEYAKANGVTQFAGLIPSGVYGERASTALLRSVEAAGGQVISLQTYERGRISAAVAKLAKPYQAVLIADNVGVATVAIPALRRGDGGASLHILGTELWNSDTAALANPALSGAWFASVPDNYYRAYTAKYRQRFNAAPYRLSTLGYDAVLLTVRIARDWPANQPFPIARLTDRDGFAGLDGAFRFGRDGVAERALEVQEVRGGAATTVSAAPTGFGGK